MLTKPHIKNLIFDLGGVILDLAVDETLLAFARLSNMDTSKVKEIFTQSQGFLDYEKGLIDDSEFRHFVRETYNLKASDKEIDSCWNAMLRGLPLQKLKLLQSLKNQYRVFLLSNTNGIHLDFINQNLLPSEAASLDDYFHRAYYSHRMKTRKPEPEIYQQVLNDNNLIAEETLFLDDNFSNTEGAQAVGIRTVYVNTPDLILDYFND